MAILKLNSQIVDQETKVVLAWDGVNGISFEDVRQFIAAIPEEDKVIEIKIDCAGGDCVQGWAMYDMIRQSGKEVHALIEGQCSSMATVVLLSAPLENRKAFANAHLCIHNPEACWLDVDYYNRLTADNMDAMAEKIKTQASSLRDEQQKILNLYVERTGQDAAVLQDLMNQDIFINMSRAKELGFISETLVPNTAHKSHINNIIMGKSNENQSAIAKAFDALGKALGIGATPVMQDLTITTPTGEELVVEREEGEPQVGDAASPDGTFVLDNGTTIVVEDGVITSITTEEEKEQQQEPETTEEPEVDPEGNKTVSLTNPSTGEEISEEEAQNLLNELTAKVAELEEKLATQTEEVEQETAALRQNQMTDEQKQILAFVDEKGGKEWIDSVSKIRSFGFHKQTTQNDLNEGQNTEKIGAGFLADHTKARYGK